MIIFHQWLSMLFFIDQCIGPWTRHQWTNNGGHCNFKILMLYGTSHETKTTSHHTPPHIHRYVFLSPSVSKKAALEIVNWFQKSKISINEIRCITFQLSLSMWKKEWKSDKKICKPKNQTNILIPWQSLFPVSWARVGLPLRPLPFLISYHGYGSEV